MANEERVQLVVSSGPTRDLGRRLSTWTEYEFNENLFTPANHFSFTLGLTGAGNDVPPEEYIERVCALTVPDAIVRLELDGILLGTGIISEQVIVEDNDGQAYIKVQGMDPASLLLSNEVDPKLKISSLTTLPEIAESILAKYRGKGLELQIVADDIANRSLLTGKRIASQKTIKTSRGSVDVGKARTGFVQATLADVQPHPGETEWDFIHRHAENLGVIPYFMADGSLCFVAPDYEQDPLYRITRMRSNPDRSNVLSGFRRLSNTATATSVHILGRGSLYRSADPNVKHRASTKSKPKIAGIANTTKPFIWPRRRFLRDTNPTNADEANRLAQRALAMRNANDITFSYILAGHRNKANYAYTVNTMALILDELPHPKIDEPALITGRVLRKTRDQKNATTTELTLVPKGAIVL